MKIVLFAICGTDKAGMRCARLLPPGRTIDLLLCIDLDASNLTDCDAEFAWHGLADCMRASRNGRASDLDSVLDDIGNGVLRLKQREFSLRLSFWKL
jgi:hypothetical protein